ncbi:EutP/PduV family microcompartment system protein [Bacteriovorax sp. Seq25_V]|uniref:EutP/PduV family microcompartment system protein n=1 Tax=Bacteriovorax sp. Seq25_V TaxID=1201288 RepID=UPI000389F3C8|nr:EutP/PduV family microcompartment system protein [Bacteriovorax sp. Seq25_V]EQC47452.1 AAA domain protein [Bacteriovorax sp. Seq25_V]
MKKVIIIGTTGSGKTTLASQIANTLKIKHIQLDQLFWKPHWGESTDDEFFEKIKKEIENGNWVIDGNYKRTNHLTWHQADTVIWIDLPKWLTLYQNFTRSLIRALKKENLWGHEGINESFRRMFSKDSVTLWMFKTYDSNRIEYFKRMQNPEYQNINFIHLKSRKEIRNFVSNLSHSQYN